MFEIDEDFDLDEGFLGDVFHSDSRIDQNVNQRRILNSSSNLCTNEIPAKGPLEKLVQINSKEKVSENAEFFNDWDMVNAQRNSTVVGTPSIKTSPFLSAFQKNVRPRKFPGPAGLLPERQSNTSLIASDDFLNELAAESNDETCSFESTDVVSQGSSGVFGGRAWQRVEAELGPWAPRLLSSINVQSVKARARTARAIKVPFMALLLHSIDASSPDPCLQLKDTTGSIDGMLHRDVWEAFGGELEVGCVLVLRNVGVISSGISSRKLWLNITANNLTAIYAPGNDEGTLLVPSDWGKQASSFIQQWNSVPSSPSSARVFSCRDSPGDGARPQGHVPLRGGFSSPSLTPSPRAPRSHRFPSPAFPGPSCGTPRLQGSASFSHSPAARQPLPSAGFPLRPGFTPSPRSRVVPPLSKEQPPKKTSGSTMLQMATRPSPFEQSCSQDSSIVDGLLDGIDTDSLFEEF